GREKTRFKGRYRRNRRRNHGRWSTFRPRQCPGFDTARYLCFDLVHRREQSLIPFLWRSFTISLQEFAHVPHKIGIGQQTCPIGPYSGRRLKIAHVPCASVWAEGSVHGDAKVIILQDDRSHVFSAAVLSQSVRDSG